MISVIARSRRGHAGLTGVNGCVVEGPRGAARENSSGLGLLSI